MLRAPIHDDQDFRVKGDQDDDHLLRLMVTGRLAADHVERWPTERLIPFARNARTHSEAQVSQIAASIREWGWTNPVLVAEDGTIRRVTAGAGGTQAAYHGRPDHGGVPGGRRRKSAPMPSRTTS
jgi:hypothetical protein